jgi:hypothetical protein
MMPVVQINMIEMLSTASLWHERLSRYFDSLGFHWPASPSSDSVMAPEAAALRIEVNVDGVFRMDHVEQPGGAVGRMASNCSVAK